MWVWICVGVGLLVALIVFGAAAVRAWRQVKALRASLTTVQGELQTYVDRMQVVSPGDHGN